MKVIRLWGVIAFLVVTLLITLVWYFIAPNLIASSIEQSGSEALGAKVEIDSIDLALFPLTVKINRLQAADPDQPMNNLFEIKQINFGIDSNALLWKKVLIDELTLDGIQMNTERSSNGALEGGRASEKLISQISSIEIPEMTEDNIQTLINKADLITVKRIKRLNENKEHLKTYWSKALDQQALNLRLKTIENEFNRLTKRSKENKFNLIKDRKKWKALKKSVDKERKTISQLNKKLKTDKDGLKQQIIDVKNGPEDDLNAIMKNVGLDNGIAGMSDKFLGPQFTPWITKALEMTNGLNSQTSSSGEKTSVYSTSQGQLVQFKDEQIFPDVLIKKLNLSGKDKAIEVSGLGSNIGYFPWLIGQPSEININLAHINPASISHTNKDNLNKNLASANLSVTSHWKTEKDMLTNINSTFSQWPINNLKLMQTEQGSWMINSGQLDSKLTGQLTLENINLTLSLKLNNPTVQSPENLSGWKSALAKSLNQQKQLNIDVIVTGTLDKPIIKVKSSIEKLFTHAIGEKIKQQASKLKGQFSKEISNKVGDLSFLDGITGDFSTWSNELKNNNDLLSKLKF
jgi:uncharacterized protein (TIGR03545 family)